jgi:outer membrane protein, heavy metal efflux system
VSKVADQWKPRQRRAQATAQEHRGRFGAWGITCLLVGLYTGCVDYQAAPLTPARSAEQFAARRLSDPQLRDAIRPLLPQAAAGWPPREWDRALLLAVALVQNPELAVARAQAQAVRAHEITAAQTPNPDLLLESEYAIHDTHPWLYGIELDWLLRSHERRRLDIELARLDTGNARLQLMDRTWAVRHALAAALSEAQGARRRLILLDRLSLAQVRLLEFEQQRVRAGEDPPGELVTGQRARIDIEQQQSEQRALADAAQAAAANALGVPPQALDGVTLAWPDWGEPPPVSDDELRARSEQALLSRADLGVAIGEYSMAETKLHLAVARQYPELILEPGYYWDHGIAKFPFDVGFTLPFNGNKGEIAEARAGRDLAGQRMFALQADIYGEIAAAGRAEHIARVNADAAERQLQAARLQEQQIDLGVRLGAQDALELTGAQILVTRAELELLQMRAQLQVARNHLEDVLHTPLSGPELALAKSVAVVPAGGS